MKNNYFILFFLVFISLTTLTSYATLDLDNTVVKTITVSYEGSEGDTYFFSDTSNKAFSVKKSDSHTLSVLTTDNSIKKHYVIRYTIGTNTPESIISIDDVVAIWPVAEKANLVWD